MNDGDGDDEDIDENEHSMGRMQMLIIQIDESVQLLLDICEEEH